MGATSSATNLAEAMKIHVGHLEDIRALVELIRVKSQYTYEVLATYGVNHEGSKATQYVGDIDGLCDKIKELL